MRRTAVCLAAGMVVACGRVPSTVPTMTDAPPVRSAALAIEPAADPTLVMTPAVAEAAELELKGGPRGDLDNFHQVDKHLYRGARPSDKGLATLKRLGIRSIINLENTLAAVQHEREVAGQLGIKFHALPMNAASVPRLATAEQFLRLVKNPANLPAYFHCTWGRDRTGTMGYVYRVSVSGWDRGRAWEEAKQYGFRRYLLGLNAFIHWYGRQYAKGETVAAAPAL